MKVKHLSPLTLILITGVLQAGTIQFKIDDSGETLHQSDVSEFCPLVAEKPNPTYIAAHLEKMDRLKTTFKSKETSPYFFKPERFDDYVTYLRNGKTTLGKYVSYSTTRNAARSDQDLFLDSLALEFSLDYSQINIEQSQTIVDLIDQLSMDQVIQLLKKGIAFRNGKISYGEFRQYLKILCKTVNANS